MKPDFIGIGAQKAGTSWIYACLYEHPQLCVPFKEIHFFSREHHYTKGIDWYNAHFSSCSPDQQKGELSTSYLYSSIAPERIKAYRPDIRLIVCLRNPVDRAFSNYQNDIMSGYVPSGVSFDAARKDHPEYLEQGLYAQQLSRYLEQFDRRQVLILIYEDSRKQPTEFIQTIFRFLDVDPHFVPSMLDRQVNVSRSQRFVGVERMMHWASGTLRKARLGTLVWWIKKRGVQDWIYRLNTRAAKVKPLAPERRRNLFEYFRSDIKQMEEILGRELKEWYPPHLLV